MTVYKFKVFFEIDSECPQKRYVVAENSEEAEEKIKAYFKTLCETGFFMKPCFISSPFVEIDYVI